MGIVGQRISAAAVKLLQRCGRRRVMVKGLPFTVARDVFNPRFFITTTFLASALRVSGEDRVLDMGTGSGFLAIAAARHTRDVIAVDINPEAVRCAAENAAVHGVSDRVSVLQGDLFSPIPDGMLFDVIVFNPPYLDGSRKTPFDLALFDPEKRVMGRFLKQAGGYLAPDGYIQMAYSSIADPDAVMKLAGESGFECRVAKQKRGLLERFFIFELFPRRVGNGL
jgi:release factor glutamine methyltransferase